MVELINAFLKHLDVFARLGHFLETATLEHICQNIIDHEMKLSNESRETNLHWFELLRSNELASLGKSAHRYVALVQEIKGPNELTINCSYSYKFGN